MLTYQQTYDKCKRELAKDVSTLSETEMLNFVNVVLKEFNKEQRPHITDTCKPKLTDIKVTF